MDNEFLLQDRLQKIRQVITQYGEENFYLSFSGGKDSTVLSALLDMAIPDNKIPRVYANTGIEYKMILDFVKKMAENDDRVVIIKPTVNIKKMLEEVGYPFKSKMHARAVDEWYNKNKNSYSRAYYEGNHKWSSRKCPKILKYQFEKKPKFEISRKCCSELKTKPMGKWSVENNKPYVILGIMTAEGGQRESAKCLAFKGNKLKAFQPLVPVTKEWEDWFIDKYDIEICDIYKPPYNFVRTGCKGCPFALELQNELDTLDKYFPAEKKQCEYIWKPVYEEYRRLGYRLRQGEYTRQMDLDEFIKE